VAACMVNKSKLMGCFAYEDDMRVFCFGDPHRCFNLVFSLEKSIDLGIFYCYPMENKVDLDSTE
jgi:hypothetical protein